MILIAIASRLARGRPLAQRAGVGALQPGRSGGLRQLFDLSARPMRRRDFAARCVLLVACAAFFYCVGAGAALFMQKSPVLALIVFGVLIGFCAAILNGHD